jgi:hypothetical protein
MTVPNLEAKADICSRIVCFQNNSGDAILDFTHQKQHSMFGRSPAAAIIQLITLLGSQLLGFCYPVV